MVQCRLYCGLDLQGVVFMNERIKQLAIEAKLIAPEYNGFDHTRLSISQQRFAELIVRECVDKITTYDLVPGHSAKWEDIYDIHARLLQDLGEELKQHFGVEE
jgi:hypothetical protein